MPLLSMAYALHSTGLYVKESYRKYIVAGDSCLLSELHASSAGLKAYITTHVSEGMESCRKMCCGHGFLVNAGFADLYTSYLPFSTLEGTKEVLQQQMGRFLLKQYIAAISSVKSEKSYGIVVWYSLFTRVTVDKEEENHGFSIFIKIDQKQFPRY